METSTPEEVLRQEGVINEVLFRTQTVLEEYPGSTDENEYIKCMDAVECYEKMVQTSRLIYNDSVTKFKRNCHQLFFRCKRKFSLRFCKTSARRKHYQQLFHQ